MEYMYCQNCGKKIPTDSHVCPYCGTPVAKNIKTGVGSRVTKVTKDSSNKSPEQPRRLSTNKRWTLVGILAVVAIIVGCVFWNIDQNSIDFVNLSNTLPGKTWQEQTLGQNFCHAKYFNNGRNALDQTSDIFDPGLDESVGPTPTNVQIRRHMLIIYQDFNKHSGPCIVLKLIKRHGDKYTFKYAQVPMQMRGVVHGKWIEYNVHDHGHLLSDGFHRISVASDGSMVDEDTDQHVPKGDMYKCLTHDITFTPSKQKPSIIHY